ncbi:NUDIX domain-containing protein [Micromonospora sp. PLK6-60]|uniref:NUDIX hydrolase n=1 Tax=Micromonospora sp. PLK6-60 TaxID=2873383 RepID=UPI001CA7286F|nr:NUDIX domain-containing protein [Micromonospora sp. PLK6-60]MBY8872721.1 NUDIX domain-containing protein [Micromonospora sp. PLK6-60]
MSGPTWAVAAIVVDDAGRVLLCRQGGGERRWALPGGRPRRPECPTAAVTAQVRRETGRRVEPVDLVGIYHLSGSPCGRPAPAGSPPGSPPDLPPGSPPDVVVHVFRAVDGRPAAEPPAGCALAWHRPDALPDDVTPVTRAAVADATAGRSGVLRDLRPEGTRTVPGTRQPEAPHVAPS